MVAVGKQRRAPAAIALMDTSFTQLPHHRRSEARMSEWARWLMVGLAVLTAGSTVRSLRKGLIHIEDATYKQHEQPMMFVVALVLRAGMIAVFLALAAGYTMEQCLRWVGLPESVVRLFVRP